MGIKILPPIEKYVNDNDLRVEIIHEEHVNEDLIPIKNNQVTECEPEDRVVNSQVNSCFVMPHNKNKMEKKQ